MILVIALPDLALRLSHIVSGARYLVSVDDGKYLRHQVHRHQPEIVLLDWRMGGNAWRAVDEISALVTRTASMPSVIALLPWVSDDVQEAAAEIGCFDVISVTASHFARDVLATIRAAQEDRHRRLAEAPRVSRGDLH
jgi:CheY-like chemotaxis protein